MNHICIVCTEQQIKYQIKDVKLILGLQIKSDK